MRIQAIDIGGTAIKASVWDGTKLGEVKEYATEAHLGGPAVVEKVMAIIAEHMAVHDDIVCIGISTAGQVDAREGSIRYANENIPGYTGMQVKAIIEKRFGIPVAVENDVNAAAIGEGSFGAGKEYTNFLCLTYGTGVGGAIVMDQQIYTGAKFSAGEFGGMIIHPEDRVEGDYFSGCYEKYASTTALVKAAKAYDAALTDGRKVFARLGEPGVQRIVDAWIKEIMYGLVSLIHIFNPPCILLGGGVFEQPYVRDTLRSDVYRHIMPSFQEVAIKAAELGNKAGLLGAVKIAQTLTEKRENN